MPLIKYTPLEFRPKSMQIILQAIEILYEYAAQGFTLTLRQLYYQFVSRLLIPNDERSYKNLGKVINNARLAGHIDWLMLVDRTRKMVSTQSWDSPQEIMQASVDSYHIDRWKNQVYRPEIWIEKDALVGVIEGQCQEMDVPFLSCRGYASQSVMWQAAQRMNKHMENGQKPKIIHLGDHDPSGIDMSRDIEDRLDLFLGHEGWQLGDDWEFERIALSMAQIKEFGPPPNPGKVTDSRFEEYCRQYGSDSWELDALEPTTMNEMIEEAVLRLREESQLAVIEDREEDHRQTMQVAVDGITL